MNNLFQLPDRHLLVRKLGSEIAVRRASCSHFGEPVCEFVRAYSPQFCGLIFDSGSSYYSFNMLAGHARLLAQLNSKRQEDWGNFTGGTYMQ